MSSLTSQVTSVLEVPHLNPKPCKAGLRRHPQSEPVWNLMDNFFQNLCLCRRHPQVMWAKGVWCWFWKHVCLNMFFWTSNLKPYVISNVPCNIASWTAEELIQASGKPVLRCVMKCLLVSHFSDLLRIKWIKMCQRVGQFWFSPQLNHSVLWLMCLEMCYDVFSHFKCVFILQTFFHFSYVFRLFICVLNLHVVACKHSEVMWTKGVWCTLSHSCV